MKMFFASLVLGALVMSHTAFASNGVAPANPCQASALSYTFQKLDLDRNQTYVYDFIQTSSAVIIRLTEPRYLSPTNDNGSADMTVFIQDFDGTTCQPNSLSVDIHNSNG